MTPLRFDVPHVGFGAWRDEVARRLVRLDFESLGDGPFRGQLTPLCSGIKIAEFSHSPGWSFRDKDLLRDGDESFALLIARTNGLDVSHRDDSTVLRRGEAMVLRCSGSGTVGSKTPCGYLSIMLSREDAGGHTGGLDRLVGQALGRSSGRLKLIETYVSALRAAEAQDDAAVTALVRHHVIELIGLLASGKPMRAEDDSAGSPVAAARLAAIRLRIAAQFSDPLLSAPGVAALERISERYLQRLLESSGTTFTALVNDLRLDHARALLSAAGTKTQRILDVALASGFTDLSHFNRLFRRRFDCTPSAMRSAA